MITIELAARVLATIAEGNARGVLHAADPQPFTYHDAAVAVSGAAKRGVGVWTLPDRLVAPLERAAPGLFASLYAPSLLDPADNCARSLPSDLYQTIAHMAQQEKSA